MTVRVDCGQQEQHCCGYFALLLYSRRPVLYSRRPVCSYIAADLLCSYIAADLCCSYIAADLLCSYIAADLLCSYIAAEQSIRERAS